MNDVTDAEHHRRLEPVLVNARFGSNRKNRELSRLRTEHGKDAWASPRPFRYV